MQWGEGVVFFSYWITLLIKLVFFSSYQGPECESIEGGEHNGTRVLFAGIEGTSAIMVFSFAKDSVKPKFESLYRRGGVDKPLSKLLDEEDLGDLNPEVLK